MLGYLPTVVALGCNIKSVSTSSQAFFFAIFFMLWAHDQQDTAGWSEAVHLFLICGEKLEEAYFVGRLSVVLLICGRKNLWGDKNVGWEEKIFPQTHHPTTSSSLKHGEPQKICPQNWLPYHQMRKRASQSKALKHFVERILATLLISHLN